MKIYVLLSCLVQLATCRVAFNSIDDYFNDVKVTKEGGKHWALIVAGSAEWYNYRHQVSASKATRVDCVIYVILLLYILFYCRS